MVDGDGSDIGNSPTRDPQKLTVLFECWRVGQGNLVFQPCTRVSLLLYRYGKVLPLHFLWYVQ